MILTRKQNFPSARVLRNYIKELTGKKILITTRNLDKDIIIRYGNSEGHSKTNFNNKEFIRLSANKVRLSNFLLEEDINTIKFSKEIPGEEEYPVIIRKKLEGFSGEGIKICVNSNEFESGFWWSKFIDFNYELGVHILGKNIARIFVKQKEEEEEEYPIRTFSNGYSFRLRHAKGDRYSKLFKFLEPVIEKLYKVGGRFYRLDIGYSRELGYTIIESNSAPGIAENPNTSKLYAEYLVKELEL